MKGKELTRKLMEKYRKYLVEQERSIFTIKKYMRDIEKFRRFAGNRTIDREVVIDYKKDLIERKYAVSSINSMLASLNSLFTFLAWQDCSVKSLKVQRKIYCSEQEILIREEYRKLLDISDEDSRLHMILETLCGTGIRISELSFFTVEAIRKGKVVVSCKNKTRVIIIPGKLRRMLLDYCKRRGIRSGIIFRTRSGKPVDRSNIWREMKKLSEKAGVDPAKVYPHNLRKLFARTHYSAEKDIAKLADILGHSSIETTRIYIMGTVEENRKAIEELGLVI